MTMRWIAFLLCSMIAACAPQSMSDIASYTSGMNYTDLPGEQASVAQKFDAAQYPPHCDPRPSFPGGNVPDTFLSDYTTPEYQRFHVCVTADAKAHAKGIEILFYMPESDLKTECSAADTYPDHKVRPAFYAYPSPPEFDRYVDCLIAEAQRDGGSVRLASAKSFPAIGACYRASVTAIGSRFGEGKPGRDAGTVIAFDNKLALIDYGLVKPVARSRVGDPVKACVADLPVDCNAYDLRGIGYKVYNLRTGESWTMGDSQHVCRGA